MNEYIVVDGYNIVHAWPELAKLKDESLEHARDRLVEILANYAGFSGDRVVVVFDAHRVKGNLERYEEINGVQIFYTREDETADSLIERLVGDMPKDGNIRVATSDWDEQRVIFGRGAYRMTPGELMALVREAGKESKKRLTRRDYTDGYLENRLAGNIRQIFEQWRRKKE
ncbi:NYN domain-containing protein [Desulfoscipio gibsoniae]|uniref:Putative RNA-binding protein containing a PIN domain n=1 Tax=Desulfoscipio gibsoniae DSM 7213 TaxID=767817 RepID=R4KHA5_9FIRM|nr:NYN domain-containing protein [Desulfoscipio gibsoniae]AGK99924.1 putative RNA-binding protein containing a PIN domain [Desulfoscipio gibsoniae DSM 7213]